MSGSPIVCTLQPEELRTRREGGLSALAARVRTRESLSNGLRLEFAAGSETLDAITRVIDAERQCCPFLRFELVVEPAGGAIALALTGPAGTREFLDGLFPP